MKEKWYENNLELMNDLMHMTLQEIAIKYNKSKKAIWQIKHDLGIEKIKEKKNKKTGQLFKELLNIQS